MPRTSKPLRAKAQAITEFEFHISPAPISSRPQTWPGTERSHAAIVGSVRHSS
jgi:hypothetical protein